MARLISAEPAIPPQGKGGVFEFNSTTGLITLKDSFTGTNGSNPFAALTAAGGGLYYGTTTSGGANGKGGVFEFNTTTGLITLKDSFAGTNGRSPTAALTTAGGTLFYGTTSAGGANDAGTIYSFNAGSPQPPTSVPAPLPLLGAGVAFRVSRHLRRRLRQAQPLSSVKG